MALAIIKHMTAIISSGTPKSGSLLHFQKLEIGAMREIVYANLREVQRRDLEVNNRLLLVDSQGLHRNDTMALSQPRFSIKSNRIKRDTLILFFCSRRGYKHSLMSGLCPSIRKVLPRSVYIR